MTTVRRAAWTLVFLCSGLLLQSVFHQPVSLWIKSGVLAGVAVAAWSPAVGLALLAAFGPLAGVIFTLAGPSGVNLQASEALTLAFIAGYAARRAVVSGVLKVTPGTRWAAGLLIGIAATAGIGAWGAIRLKGLAQPTAEIVGLFLTRDYLLHLAGSTPITTAALLSEGALLLVAAADLCAGRRDDRDAILQAMVIGGAAAGSLNILRIVAVSLRTEDAWRAFVHFLATLRVNVHYGDLNAAGSYFALLLPIAIALLWRRRVLAAIAAPPIALALWISGSRAALACALLTLAAAALFALRGGIQRARPLLAGVALLAIAAVTLWWVYPHERNTAPSSAIAVRLALTRGGLHLAAQHPVLGVGIGRFYEASEDFLRDAPERIEFGLIGLRENAHNYFIQILAELGVPGLAIFLAIAFVPLRILWRSATPLPATSVGLLAGIAAFLLSSLGGHPLIIPEASYPFWIALGLAASSAASPPAAAARRLNVAGAALVVACILAIPARTALASRSVDVSGVSVGLSRWQREPDGLRYRWAGGRATFFVPAAARAIRVPLRRGSEGPDRIEVGIFVDGREVNRVIVQVGENWRTVRIVPRVAGSRSFMRVDLEAYGPGRPSPIALDATDTHGLLMVGQPDIEY